MYSGDPATVTVTFSEAVTGFANDDLTVENGTLTAVSSADGNRTFTATFTADNIGDATNTITLNLTGVADTAGNAGSGTVSSANYSIAIPTAPGAPTIGTAMAGDTQATVQLYAARVNRRPGDHGIYGYGKSRRRDRDRRREPHHGDGPYHRGSLHLYGHGNEQRGHGLGLAAVETA